ncbi:PPOX class F420-dependent oxidoreductase [Candidatus Nitrosotalea okcheonensis]|nr:PPOX class F420-dependent oxidoreductase [Candidatus Nitrosotalea okcheonensis]MDE1728337.1 PPOX class F420-dependent oxidoreductase [Nitrososphaerota archaeon]MDE1831056.1 PPOX class F420-dependent oxidoreductase [Nitrososphaerota archaeon]MDE1840919.1 PPOX class F420-dependent oxidoreductase [Nitrososphaerota archaeon]MDE1877270.1 PPOX class F420-dependent oxidoreductase [Nitrososphaerota archaeon]
MTLQVAQLIEDKNLAFVATLMKNNSPQITPVWIDLVDGKIIVNTAEGRVKQRNVSRDPRVAISIVDRNNPYNMVTIRGQVVEQTVEGADEHIDKMAKKYLGVDKYPFAMPGEKRIMLKIVPQKIFHMMPHS